MRDAIASMLRAIRALQIITGFKDSEILQIMVTVYRETDGAVMNVYLAYVLLQARRDERNRKQHGTF